jgi:hypothetical protein
MKPLLSKWKPIVGVLFSVLFILYIQNVRKYLDKIETCNCAPLQYVTRLYHLETVFLYLLYIGIVLSCITGVYPNWVEEVVPVISKFKYVNSVAMFGISYLLFMMILMITFIYNVYEYYVNIKPDCGCIDQTESNMLYIQAIYYGLGLVFPLLTVTAVFVVVMSSGKRIEI